MFNNTITATDCDFRYENIISYSLNVLLLVATIYSEFSGASKCSKHNGIVDGIIRKISKRDITENEDKKEELV